MEKGKEVYRHVKLTDNIKTTSLSIMDQLRLMFSKLSNDDVAELNTNEKLTSEKMRKVAALTDFLDKVTDRLSNTNQPSVTVSVASEFLPYIDEVINDVSGKGRFYDFEVMKKNIPIDVKHQFIVKIKKKIR